MTTTTRAGGRRAALRRGWRRGRRTLIPFGVVLLLLVATLVTRAVDTPDTGDEDFLSPVSDAAIGSARLADALRGQGITVVRHTDPRAALTDAGGATLFVPAAEFLDAQSVNALRSLPASTRVVLVDPPARTLRGADVPLLRGQRRWATAPVASDGCAIPGIAGAGAAAARRQSYVVEETFNGGYDACYDRGVLRFGYPQEVVVVGAADPFLNGRLDEHANRTFASGLLSTRPKLVWLDLHEPWLPPKEPKPTYTPDPSEQETYEPPTAEPQDQFTAPPARDGNGSPGDRRSSGEGDGDSASITDAFPPWVWAMLATLAAALLLLLLWAGRRLGPAVTEPLPVEVRSGETVLGRGRLYQRAKARGPAAEVLRHAARKRIEPALGLDSEHTPADVVAAVAARTGRDPAQVDGLLYGRIPAHDDELLDLARGLHTLADEVGGVVPAGQSRDTQPGSAGPDQGEPR
ncbi:hypothetical protein Ais01nite_41250 [Asanoa ishikariensis]|uniref:DUF4350 domain-containing protein n=1 Tax=Asanoa ishikariensis TaxID=137265 RepID=A0A1H3MFV8_9ACTN|nr:DUF4350 domain-containing protein [Asanoa ishikariensis]GIF66090.1 hypothetical protein Ais01nite_41250 [Asanoa ishikariensis]SDY75198.1 hypothetical protein SAMN05421684_1363 [Asanoa ishikariensis]